MHSEALLMTSSASLDSKIYLKPNLGYKMSHVVKKELGL